MRPYGDAELCVELGFMLWEGKDPEAYSDHAAKLGRGRRDNNPLTASTTSNHPNVLPLASDLLDQAINELAGGARAFDPPRTQTLRPERGSRASAGWGTQGETTFSSATNGHST